MQFATILVAAALGVLTTVSAQGAGSVSGQAEAINADILKVGEARVVLWGIDAPDPGQPCSLNGRPWGCFDAAMRALQIMVSRGPVTCLLTDQTDPYNRSYGVCEVAGEDVGGALVSAGLAVAYSVETEAYAPMQQEAIGASVGLWQPGVQFQLPWEWREIESPGAYK